MTAGRLSSLMRPAPRWARVCAFLLLLIVPSVIELGLADRKFGILSGGFGASRVIVGADEKTVFALLYGATQLFTTMIVWAIATFLHRRAWRSWLCVFGIGGVATGIALVIVAARYELARYFSDALSFELIRQLGGGSLLDAALFVLNGNVVLPAVAIVAIGFGLWILVRFARRLDTGSETPWRISRNQLAATLGLFVALPLLLAVADHTQDLRYSANRMIGIATLRSLLAVATDFDDDGYGAYSLQRDPAPFDASRYPMALDAPGNGIDEDGIGGDWKPLAPTPAPPVFRFPARPPNIVVIVIESLRGDVLGRRINGRAVAPNLEALARAGVSAPAYSHVGFTTNSLKSVFTGELLPRDDRHSLFPLLRKAGYRIGVFSGQPESFGNISGVTGMRANADVFVDANILKDERADAFSAEGSLHVDGTRLLNAFDGRFSRAADWNRPVFLYFNLQTPHFPYWHKGMENFLEPNPLRRSEIVPEARDRLLRTYMNAVAWSDYHVGQLVARLRKLGVLDNTIILVTGDHGESLFDNGFLGHGHHISRAQNQTTFVLNRPIRIDADAIGLSDYTRILAAAVAGERQVQLRGPVLMHIGELDSPVRIGSVSRGQWSVYDIENDLWNTGGRNRPGSALSPAERDRRDRLIALWSQRRWESRAGKQR